MHYTVKIHTHCSCITVQYTVHLTGTAQLVQLLYYNFNILYFTPSNLLMYVQFHLSLWIAVDLTDQLLTLPKICPHLNKSAQASTALEVLQLLLKIVHFTSLHGTAQCCICNVLHCTEPEGPPS